MAYNNNNKRYKRQEKDDNNLPKVFQRLGSSSRSTYSSIDRINDSNGQRYDDGGGLRIARYNSANPNSSQRSYPDYSKISQLREDAIYYTPNNNEYSYNQPIKYPTNNFRFIRNDSSNDTSRPIISFLRDTPTSNQPQQQPPPSPTSHNNPNNNYNNYNTIYPMNNNNRTIVQENQEYQEPVYHEQQQQEETQEIDYNNDRININIAKKIQITASIPTSNMSNDQLDDNGVGSNSNTNTNQILTPKRKVIVTIPERERSSSSERKRSRRSSPPRNKRTRSPSPQYRSRRPRRSSTVIYDSDEEIPFLNLKSDCYVPRYTEDDDKHINNRLSGIKKYKDLRSHPPLGFVESHHKVWTKPSENNTSPLSKKFTPGATKTVDITPSTARSIPTATTNSTIVPTTNTIKKSMHHSTTLSKSANTSTTPTKPITTPTKPITTPTKPITTPTKPITIPTKPITTPTKPITTPTKPVATPVKPVAMPTKHAAATPTKPVGMPTKPVATPAKPVTTTSVKPAIESVKSTATTLTKPSDTSTKSLPTKPISFIAKLSSKQIKPIITQTKEKATDNSVEKHILNDKQSALRNTNSLSSDNTNLENTNNTADNNTTNSNTSESSVKHGIKKQSNDIKKADILPVSQDISINKLNNDDSTKNRVKEIEEQELLKKGEKAKNLLRQLAVDERDDIVMDIPSSVRITPNITPILNNHRQCNRSDSPIIILKEEPISDDVIMLEKEQDTTIANDINMLEKEQDTTISGSDVTVPEKGLGHVFNDVTMLEKDIISKDVTMSEKAQDIISNDATMSEKRKDPIFDSITSAIQNTVDTIMGKLIGSSITEKIKPVKILPEINTQETVLDSPIQPTTQLLSPPVSSNKETAPLLPIKPKTSSTSTKLPPGWRVRMTDSGEILYRDPETGKETPTRPVW